MNVPDYDDYYSLTSYASRFTRDPDKEISAWLSQRSTLNAIIIWEKAFGDDCCTDQSVAEVLDAVDSYELINAQYVVSLLSLRCMFLAEGEVFADLSLYNDFVAYLTSAGINI